MIGAILMVCTLFFYMYSGAIATSSGGVVAAPIAKSCLESILPILSVEKSNSSIEYVYRYGLDANLIIVDDYVGKKLKKINKQYSVNYLVIGDGDIVISQSPEKGEKIKEGDTIILYLG